MRRAYRRREVLQLGLGALGAAVAAACNGIEAVPEPADGDDQALPFRERVPPARPSVGGVIRIGTVGPATGVATPSLTPEEALLSSSRLVALDPRTALVYGDLAAEIERPDGLAVRFRLHPEAYFHPDARGEIYPITSEAVRDSFERAGESALFDRVVEAIETPDDETVTLYLRGPFALLFEHLGGHEASVRSESTYDRFSDGLGSGPFFPAARDGNTDILVRHPRYHYDAYPRLDEIDVERFEDVQGVTAAFDGGRLDVQVDAPAQPVDGEVARTAVREQRRASHRLLGLGLSLLPQKDGRSVRHVAAFQDERVRRAVSLALDREAIAAQAGGETSGPVTPAHRADALPPEELASHPLYLHSPDEARRLLEAAGASGLAFRLLLPDLSRHRAVARLIGGQLREGGFAPALAPIATEEWDRAFVAGDFEATLFEIDRLTTPDLALRLHVTGGLEGRFSPWGYSNPVYDAAVRDALSRISPAERASRSREAQRVLLHDVPAMFPLAAPLERARVAEDVGGYEFDAYHFNAAWLAPAWELLRDPTAGTLP